MSKWKKILIIAACAVVVLALAGFMWSRGRRNLVTVQTGKVHRQTLVSTVSASGEIKPKTYVNIGANAFGKIIRLHVKEGERVKAGAMLAQLENVQPSADVAASQASLEAARIDAIAARAALRTAEANLSRARADGDRAKLDYDRAIGLFKEELIAKQDFDAKKSVWETADATIEQTRAQILQSRAQLDSAEKKIAQGSANLRHAADVLTKTEYRAPFAGTVTNLPVREGETVVIGIQNAPGSTLMTLADMSVITAELKVDETDIVSVRLGQAAEVTIDAIPKKTFRAVVTEIGENALLRSTGVASSQSTSSTTEAKDFKVVVTLEEPPENLRPGLSCTAKITTATKKDVLTIPIQALTAREAKDLVPVDQDKGKDKDKPAATVTAKDKDKDKAEMQGVFLVRNGKAEFASVETGTAGTTDIEVIKGLNESEELVTGSYKVLRTMRNGAAVKVDNTPPKKPDATP